MKLKATLGLVLAVVLSFAPLAANPASSKDPGALPIDELLQSEEAYIGEAQRVYDSGQIFDSTEEERVNTKEPPKLQKSYFGGFLVQYCRLE